MSNKNFTGMDFLNQSEGKKTTTRATEGRTAKKTDKGKATTNEKEKPVKKAVITLQKNERKDRRVQLLLKPSTYDKAKAEAEAMSMSLNELINSLLESYLDR